MTLTPHELMVLKQVGEVIGEYQRDTDEKIRREFEQMRVEIAELRQLVQQQREPAS